MRKVSNNEIARRGDWTGTFESPILASTIKRALFWHNNKPLARNAFASDSVKRS